MKKWLLWLDKNFEESIMVVLLGSMVVIMGVQVFMRYVLSNSLAWPEELTRYLFIWFVFLGISYGIKNNVHLKVDLLEVILPGCKQVLCLVQDLLFLVFCLIMVQPSLSGVSLLMDSGQTSPAMQVPMFLIYISLLAGFLLAIFRLLQKHALRLLNRNKEAGL